MNASFTFKKLVIATVVITLIVTVFLVHALAGLNATPVVFAEPPAFVDRYVAAMDHSTPSSVEEVRTNIKKPLTSKFEKLTADFSNEEKLVFKVIMYGEPLDELLRLFTHPDKTQRIKIASAFSAVNVKYTHSEETGFPKKRNQFWKEKEAHFPVIQNALSEALIESAEAGTSTNIPYTLAWLPNQSSETIDLFIWTAMHHPVPRVRRASLYYVVKLKGDEKLVTDLLQSRAHDPDYIVRREALDLRYRRLTGQI